MLVITPKQPMFDTWPGEIEKWEEFGDLTYTILHGPRKVGNLFLPADIFLINPEGLLWLLERDDLPEWDILVVDESTKFKHQNNRRGRLLRKKIANFTRRWILTGTPCPNGLLDLYGQIYILDRGAALGQYYTHYKDKYFHLDHMGGFQYLPNEGSFEKITTAIKPLVYQLSAEDHIKMPKLVYVNRPVKLDEYSQKIHDAMYNEFIVELRKENYMVAANAAVAGIKCRQIANGAVYHEDGVEEVHTEKCEALEDLIEELAGKPALILYEFNHDRERVIRTITRVSGPGTFRVLSSARSQQYIQESINLFNAGKLQYLLGHPESMGFGLNLQMACHHVIWFSIPWRLDHYDQAIARVYRQGQQADTVFVYNILAKATVDEKVLGVLNGKDRTQQAVLKALAG